MRVLLVLAAAAVFGLIGCLDELQHKQIVGLRSLLHNLHGVYATCNLVLFSEMADYDTAQERCANFDIGTGGGTGNLATVNDEDKNTDLKLLLHLAYPFKGGKDKWNNDQWVWAGLRKTRHNDGSKKSRKYNNLDWEWVDGSHPGEFSMWMKNQPDQKKKGKYLQNQMRINHHGHWDDTFTYKTHPYVCDYRGKYIVSPNMKTWHSARDACEHAGLHLAKVRSKEEVHELVQAAENFLGPRNDTQGIWSPTNWMWLGGSDAEEEGVWKWLDGTPVAKFEGMVWRPPNPDNADFLHDGSGTQNFLALSRWGELDDSYDSPHRHRPFACQCPGS